MIPYASKTPMYKFEDLPEASGEPDKEEDPDDPEELDADHHGHWRKENLTKGQMLSGAGPSGTTAEKKGKVEVLPELVNPEDHGWLDPDWAGLDLEAVDAFWARLRTDEKQSVPNLGLRRDELGDDYQQLFVHILLEHVRDLIRCIHSGTTSQPEPLRLLLLGKPGSGKTRAAKTALQEIFVELERVGLPASFVLVAAPTGTAAFNIRFPASTVHRLIHWFTPPFFSELDPRGNALLRLQEYLRDTRLILVDEVSMFGRQFAGRADSRFAQGKAGGAHLDKRLGGLSFVGVGDPAQCEALHDQQIYDAMPHKATAEGTRAAELSNRGLEVYRSCTKVVVLTGCHRLKTVEAPKTKAEEAYNDRAMRWVRTLRRLRDLTWTMEDYFWLCERKRSKLSFAERAGFTDAPIIMDYRRTTEARPEDNCDFYNTCCLRRMVREKRREDPAAAVARFPAWHDGVKEQDEGERLDESQFRGLPAWMELAKHAHVLLTFNLALGYGLMNGSFGKAKAIVFDSR